MSMTETKKDWWNDKSYKPTYEERKKLTEEQIAEMSREELNKEALEYWELLMKQQQVLRNIKVYGDEYSREMAKGVLNGTLEVVYD